MTELEQLRDQVLIINVNNSYYYYQFIAQCLQAYVITFSVYKLLEIAPQHVNPIISAYLKRLMIIKLFRHIQEIPNINQIMTKIIESI